jgi:hypothetical protein
MTLTLPGPTINDPVKERRLLDAFRPTPSSTNAEAATEYRRWHTAALIGEVRRREQLSALQQASAGSTDPSDILDNTTP